MKYNQKTTVNALSLTITTACLILLSGCSKKNYDEDYTICVINDSPTSISISIKSGWEQQLEPYGHTGDLNPIYHIPKTETIEWTRGGQDYSEEIPIKQLLDGYNKTMGNIFYIIRENNDLLIRYEVDENIYFLKDSPQYKRLREKNEKLVEAIKDADIKSVRQLIEDGVSVNPESSLFENPLQIAVKNGNFNATKLLLEYGAKIEPLYYFGDSALTIACADNNLDLVKILVEGGADVNYEGNYPLSEACERGHYEIAKFLIESGANPNPSSTMSQPPMACAIRSQNPQVFKLLLDNGVSLDTEWATSTFRDYAYEKGGHEIISILEKDSVEK